MEFLRRLAKVVAPRRGWSTWILDAYDVLLPEMAPNEVVVKDMSGVLLRGPFLSSMGRLVLTNFRIIFLAFKLKAISRQSLWPRLKIDLAEIVEVSECSGIRRLWGGYPYPGLSVFQVILKDGASHRFQVAQACSWCRAIQDLGVNVD